MLGRKWIPQTQIEWSRPKNFENRSRIGRDRHVFIQKLAFRAEIPTNPTYLFKRMTLKWRFFMRFSNFLDLAQIT